MSQTAQNIVERRRLRRRLSLWRFVALVAAVLGLGLLMARLAGDSTGLAGADQIARVKITGFISDDLKQQNLLKKIAKSKKVKALILRINSPGGSTTGSEALYEAVREVADKKPVVAVLGTVAASGGYVAAISADHIVARGNTLTGSIGVIMQWPEVAELLGKVGLKYREVKSSPLKAEPSPFRTPSEEVLKVTRAAVADSYVWFRDLVAERRGLEAEKAAGLADGRVFTGRQAKEAGLVDAIGGEKKALEWLQSEKKIDKKLKIHDWESGSLKERALSGLLISALVRALGLEKTFPNGLLTGSAPSSRLDGLLSVWHPAG